MNSAVNYENEFLFPDISRSPIYVIYLSLFNWLDTPYNYYADAIITNQRNLPIAVLTADCVPILLYDKEKDIIAAIHAGWRGAYKGIIKNVVKFMIKKGCKSKNILAAIGPSISSSNYNSKMSGIND